MLPSEFYRTSVKQLCMLYKDPEDADQNAAFFSYVEENYFESKRHLQENAFENETKKISARNGLFVFAVAVFSYGKIEAASDVLKHIPSSGNIRRLALSLKALLPLPEDLDPLEEPGIVMQWLETNSSKMEWDESLGVYAEN